MTTIELTRFLNALKSKEAELESRNRGWEALAIEPSPDELDRIQSCQERDWAMSALDRDSKLLHRVRAARGRIDTGTFGICLDCEDAISVKRLTALPWTPLCIACYEVSDHGTPQPWSASEELLVRVD
jgi:DnaK suppressor protein